MLKLDHIVLAAESLVEGVNYVEERLEHRLDAGGKHEMFGTHNRLLSLGDCYFEVIAKNPEASSPQRAVWFDLNNFRGPPRMVTWVCETKNMAKDCVQAPYPTGAVTTVSRDDLIWDLTIPTDGSLPCDGVAPALIDWKGTASPSARLPDRGFRLTSLRLSHPNIYQIGGFLDHALHDNRIIHETSGHISIQATIKTPDGRVITL